MAFNFLAILIFSPFYVFYLFQISLICFYHFQCFLTSKNNPSFLTFRETSFMTLRVATSPIYRSYHQFIIFIFPCKKFLVRRMPALIYCYSWVKSNPITFNSELTKPTVPAYYCVWFRPRNHVITIT